VSYKGKNTLKNLLTQLVLFSQRIKIIFSTTSENIEKIEDDTFLQFEKTLFDVFYGTPYKNFRNLKF
jgi:hypothetical protein